jgi:serine/threonine-protein kinase
MPFIEGETLRGQAEPETQLGVNEAVWIAREVAGAMNYAQQGRGPLGHQAEKYDVASNGNHFLFARALEGSDPKLWSGSIGLTR